MMICLLTCCEALDIEALGPVFSDVLPAGGTVTAGVYVVALLSPFPMAGAASAGVSMGMPVGASVVTED
jgi:hypothetical protein